MSVLQPSRLRPVLFAMIASAALLAARAAKADDAAPPITQDPLAEHYQLGHGLTLGDTGIRLGGYGDLSYLDLDDHDPSTLTLDSLSAMLWWDGGGRLHFFSETEVQDLVELQRGNSTTHDTHAESERLYFDWTWRDEFKVRLGKFLTPIGRWNVSHAPPLTWTTSRPLITEATFPTNATGLMFYGNLPLLADGVEYSVYGSTGHEIFPDHQLDTFSEAIGARLNATVATHLQLGLSVATFEQESEPDQRKRLFGVDFLWSKSRWEVSGEFAYRTIKDHVDIQDEQGLYLQLVAPLTERWYAVARYERFHPAGANDELNLALAGIDWRPMPAVILKSEYSYAPENPIDQPDGFRASIAVLF